VTACLRLVAVCIALGAATAAYAAASVAATRGGRHCSGGFDVNGRASRTNQTWREIREQGTTCAKARAVVQRFVKKTHGNPSSLLGKHVTIATYACEILTKHSADNPYGAATCTASHHRRITFVAAG
jgi:hypothetical protein